MTELSDYAPEPDDHPGGEQPDEPDAGGADVVTNGDPGEAGEDDSGQDEGA
jgi:hypothetical protein